MTQGRQLTSVSIIYNSADNHSVQLLAQKLKTESVNVWIDYEQLVAGDALTEKLEIGLKSSQAALVCIGKNGSSEQQLIQIGMACEIRSETGLRIIPVLLPGADRKTIPSLLKELLYIDFRESVEDKGQFKNLIQALRGNEVESIELSTPFREQVVSNKIINKWAVSVGLFYKDEILVIQRADSQKSGTGLWQLPGGKINDQETPIEAAVREIDEEVGIQIDKERLKKVVELVDTWLIGDKADFITMNLFIYNVSNKQTCVSKEFKNHKWLKLSEVFNDKKRVYFGSTGRYISAIRRYKYLYIPLTEILTAVSTDSTVVLPTSLNGLSAETSQTIYEFLSILGFLSDKQAYSPSSTLTASLIKMLSEWSLTEASIFEAEGDKNWYDKVEEEWDVEQVARFREGLFDQHKNLLGLLSHKLPKALSNRNICDIIVTGHNPKNGKSYLLVRWDFLANKFQIPAKGLEDIDPDSSIDISSEEAAKYVVRERFDSRLSEMFNFKYLEKIKTSHVGAGSLGDRDGPILRNYVIAIFGAFPRQRSDKKILEMLNEINKKTLLFIDGKSVLGDAMKRALNFYVWAELDLLEGKPQQLIGKKLQGYFEIASEFGNEFFKNLKFVKLSSEIKIPIIERQNIIQREQIDMTCLKEY